MTRWMAFVDGENLTLRGQQVAESVGLELTEGEFFKRDCFVWIPGTEGRTDNIALHASQNPAGRAGADWSLSVDSARYASLLGTLAVRAFYYTSVTGDDLALDDVREKLWKLGFSPHVFKRTRKDQKAKGVDIALTKDMLGQAFLGNYEVAFLYAGDGDYVPLVEEVKRLGKQVYLAFFPTTGLSPELRLACDRFYNLGPLFVDKWGWATGKQIQIPR